MLFFSDFVKPSSAKFSLTTPPSCDEDAVVAFDESSSSLALPSFAPKAFQMLQANDVQDLKNLSSVEDYKNLENK